MVRDNEEKLNKYEPPKGMTEFGIYLIDVVA